MIKLEQIDRHYIVGTQEVHALNQVNLDIGSNDYCSIMGPSGSGKSTLLNVIGLLDHPDNGRYLFDGQDVTTLNDDEQAHLRQRRIGFVFQFFHLITRLDTRSNVALPLILAGVPAIERQERVAEAIHAVGLESRAGHRPDQLSGGQRQRVAIARAIVMKPAILLADEPTGNLDRHSGNEIIDLLEGLHDSGLTLLIVTHDPRIGQRARRLLRMEDGRIVGDDIGTAP